MKQLKKGLKAIAMALLVLIVAIVAINAFDDKLDPKAAAAGEPRSPRVQDAQNGYFALLALGADDGTNSAVYAKAWLDEARAAARENRVEKRSPAKRTERPELCDPVRVSCLTAVKYKVAENEALLEVWKEDLARYEKLIASAAYEEVLDYPLRLESGFPAYVNVGKAQRAYLARVTLAVHAGRAEDAVAQLEKDVAFQRVMLAGSRTLIGRMIAAANYTRDLAFITDVLQTSTVDLKPLAPRVSEMLKPLPPGALAMETLFETEFAASKHMLRNSLAGEGGAVSGVIGWLGKHTVYKTNQTINMAYRDYEAAGKLGKLPASELRAMANAPTATPDMTWWNYIENPMGNILVRIATPSFHGYALRLRDLDAHNRLLAVAAEIFAQDVVTENVADFVAKSDARFYDPYTGKPMAWDAASKRLSFKRGQADNNRATFNVDKGVVFVTL